MTRTLVRCVILSALWAAVPALCAADAEGWPQLLGPHRNGISAETGLNFDWKTKPPKIAWRVPLGSGCSAVSVVGDRLYTMAKRGDRDVVVCLDAKNGKEIWSYDAAPSYTDVQKHMPGPRATPTVAHDKLYCLMPMGELICLTAADGKLVWREDTFKVSGAANPHGEFYYWGVSLSPLVEGDLVIVQPGGTKGNSVLAFNKDTGKVAWSVGDDPAGYASPIAITVAGTRQLVCPTGRSILGIEPAKGKILWRYEFGNRFNVTAATPLWIDNLLFVSAAYGAGCAALEIVQDGDKWTVREKWKNKDLQNVFATSMIVDGYVYGCHGDIGAIMLRCLDLKTGEMKWSQRQRGRSSLLAVDKHLIVLNEQGGLQLLEAKPEAYTLKGEMADLLSFRAWAQPALAEGRLYLRDQKDLVCVDLHKD